MEEGKFLKGALAAKYSALPRQTRALVTDKEKIASTDQGRPQEAPKECQYQENNQMTIIRCFVRTSNEAIVREADARLPLLLDTCLVY